MAAETPEEVLADAEKLVAWYKTLSDETKNYWTFRWTRVEDKDFQILYETMKAAEKLYRSMRAAEKKAAKAEHRKKDD